MENQDRCGNCCNCHLDYPIGCMVYPKVMEWLKVLKDIKKYLTTIMYWAFVLFLAYLIFELIRAIVGGTLGFEELVIGLLIANLGYSFYLREAITRIDTRLASHIGYHKGKV